MKVLDFDLQKFKEFVKQVLVNDAKSFDNILVLGIAEGGLPIAQIVYDTLNEHLNSSVSQGFIMVQRPSTKNKKKSETTQKFIKSIFSITPKFILNYLRIREHKKLSKRSKSDLQREIKWNEEPNFSRFDLILIVDDAVDSGASMKKTLDFVKEKVNNSTILKTVSVVVTQKKPVYMPDYFQFRDVLIRFPWSLDGRK